MDPGFIPGPSFLLPGAHPLAARSAALSAGLPLGAGGLALAGLRSVPKLAAATPGGAGGELPGVGAVQLGLHDGHPLGDVVHNGHGDAGNTAAAAACPKLSAALSAAGHLTPVGEAARPLFAG
ncbi:hypothetical protein SDC9_142990 [bioreactor metagenome]|uniref:Uncharacterized protein n=1 Tax=bioreactor metagenome TaxID=1076179 RepID=A0A645E2S5_9ZZZZ